MNLRITAWTGALIGTFSLALCATPVQADDATGQAVPTTSKIAVCDPIKVLSQIQEGKDAMAKWKQEGETLQNQANVKRGQLQTEQDEIKLLLPTSDEFEKKVEKFTEDQMDTQAWLQAAELNFSRKRNEEEKDLFNKILKSISDIAAAQKIQLVLNSSHADFPAEVDKMDANAFVQTILLHTTLFADTTLDITPQVIIAMDKNYSTSH